MSMMASQQPRTIERTVAAVVVSSVLLSGWLMNQNMDRVKPWLSQPLINGQAAVLVPDVLAEVDGQTPDQSLLIEAPQADRVIARASNPPPPVNPESTHPTPSTTQSPASEAISVGAIVTVAEAEPEASLSDAVEESKPVELQTRPDEVPPREFEHNGEKLLDGEELPAIELDFVRGGSAGQVLNAVIDQGKGNLIVSVDQAGKSVHFHALRKGDDTWTLSAPPETELQALTGTLSTGVGLYVAPSDRLSMTRQAQRRIGRAINSNPQFTLYLSPAFDTQLANWQRRWLHDNPDKRHKGLKTQVSVQNGRIEWTMQ